MPLSSLLARGRAGVGWLIGTPATATSIPVRAGFWPASPKSAGATDLNSPHPTAPGSPLGDREVVSSLRGPRGLCRVWGCRCIVRSHPERTAPGDTCTAGACDCFAGGSFAGLFRDSCVRSIPDGPASPSNPHRSGSRAAQTPACL